MGGVRAYIGSFTSAGGRGILMAAVDQDTGALSVLGATDALSDPSYLALAPDGDVLYAVGETDEGQAAAFGVRGDKPELLGAPALVGGSGPTHLALAQGHVLTANYGSGSVSWLPLNTDGSLDGAGGVLRHEGTGPVAARQEGPHAHQVLPDPSGRWVLSVDLGTDSVRVCALTAGELRLHHEVALRPGSGPRHLAFHPRGDLAYVMNELAPTLTTCRWDAEAGRLEPLGEIPVLAGQVTGDAYPSEVVIAPDGRFAWTATRGQDAISVLALDAEGRAPRLVTTVDCGGHWPRDLAVHPSGRFLYAANERSGDVTWFAVDPQTGIPERAGSIEAPAASCVVFG
ncbi:lactonase family protein [Streptomyces sp. NBC_01304]|uniref:lactonase family protein n=1 Tax=Streptomyces sp. NBC_01304 TaxID=2903818 RepID=UPI002E1043DE|nr:lactonase family protein [Streptomyces sp. NBC_01304]